MVTSKQCYDKYGEPSLNNKNLILWDVPANLEIGMFPNKLYCNKDIVEPLSAAFSLVIDRGLINYIKTFDGCFNIRKKRGLNSMSLHSWGIAVDLNAFENQLGQEPKMSIKIVQCFEDAGFDWGGRWQRRDGMHFQLSKI